MDQRREVLKRIAADAGERLRLFYREGVAVRKKSELDLITIADETIERQLVSAIREHFPTDEIQAEEGGSAAGSSGYKWIIDPVDGTTNFAHGLPQFAISIALAKDGQVLSGMVVDPAKDEVFEAHLGEGATLNGRPIRVAQHRQLSECLVVTGFPYDRRQRIDMLLERVRRILMKCQGMRRLGAAALDLCYVACGRFDIYLEDGLNAWDIAAGQLIVREAGGVATMFDGGALDLDGRQILAANAALLPLAIAELL